MGPTPSSEGQLPAICTTVPRVWRRPRGCQARETPWITRKLLFAGPAHSATTSQKRLKWMRDIVPFGTHGPAISQRYHGRYEPTARTTSPLNLRRHRVRHDPERRNARIEGHRRGVKPEAAELRVVRDRQAERSDPVRIEDAGPETRRSRRLEQPVVAQ